ncbi:MAG: Wzz/FepE/Etk N-terminal domain-containing protein [Terracidiphilus sp.]|jgi:uncharacterized protein involved in exopolysaccharide biosynthesis
MSTEIREPVPRAARRFNPVLASLLEAASRRRRLVLIAAPAIVLLSAAIACLLPNLYTASVVILPPQGNSTSTAMLAQLSNLTMLGSVGGGLAIKNPNDMQVALLKSRTVEDAMVERFQLLAEYHKRTVSAARKRWERMTAIDNGLKDGLIRISVTDRDPRRAAELASGWVDEYRRLTASLAVTEASQRRLFFAQELDGARGDLARAEDNLKDTEQRTGVMEIDGQARAMIASAAMLRAKVAEKQVEIGAMRQFAASGNPDLARAEQELSGLESQLAAMDLDSDHATGDLVSPKGKITQAGLDYTRAVREVKYRETMYELLTRQYEVARVDEARQGSLIQIVDPAIAPDRPSSRYRFWIVLGGIVLALPLALGAAWIAEVAVAARGLRRRYGSWIAAVEQSWAWEAR